MKLEVVIYVTPNGVTEVAPTEELVAVRHHLSHPDAIIKIWRTPSAKTSGRYEKIRHAVMVALQASGVSVAALRDYSNKNHKAEVKTVSDKQRRLI